MCHIRGGDRLNAMSSPTISDYKPASILRNSKDATFGRNQKREDSPDLSPVNVVSSYDPLRQTMQSMPSSLMIKQQKMEDRMNMPRAMGDNKAELIRSWLQQGLVTREELSNLI